MAMCSFCQTLPITPLSSCTGRPVTHQAAYFRKAALISLPFPFCSSYVQWLPSSCTTSTWVPLRGCSWSSSTSTGCWLKWGTSTLGTWGSTTSLAGAFLPLSQVPSTTPKSFVRFLFHLHWKVTPLKMGMDALSYYCHLSVFLHEEK